MLFLGPFTDCLKSVDMFTISNAIEHPVEVCKYDLSNDLIDHHTTSASHFLLIGKINCTYDGYLLIGRTTIPTLYH